jgi:hypothetical protein
MSDKPENYREYVADRQVKISKLIRELRASPALFKEFGANANEVAKKFGLTLTEDEATKIREVAPARVSDDIDVDALEAVAGGIGGPNANCDCPNGSNCS